jgi:hypothetical protein
MFGKNGENFLATGLRIFEKKQQNTTYLKPKTTKILYIVVLWVPKKR